ncbi:rhodanese-like domain-containing protein [Sulfitobacter sp. F26204]|uniref:rhodanese-like domain-containing protein n=1 Tax=Sulfitobacter sp. F26204 TaxID=2996014 RepID=UPI00225E2FE5|nr:rhodanese-like domain-containing protein [Sulfitobacter sp. F26204]MCX7558984.1 rhodanese-like domain-containing protein [Sulfitobacter sp. F26204]
MAGIVALGGIGAAQWFNVTAQMDPGDLTAPEALAAAIAGEIKLIDIRRPEEWVQTGIGLGAVPIDMRDAAFIDILLAQTDGRRDVPVALICARGVRSAALSTRLVQAGFTQVLDVPEGMSGSGAGAGWIKRGLPVVQP